MIPSLINEHIAAIIAFYHLLIPYNYFYYCIILFAMLCCQNSAKMHLFGKNSFSKEWRSHDVRSPPLSLVEGCLPPISMHD